MPFDLLLCIFAVVALFPLENGDCPRHILDNKRPNAKPRNGVRVEDFYCSQTINAPGLINPFGILTSFQLPASDVGWDVGGYRD